MSTNQYRALFEQHKGDYDAYLAACAATIDERFQGSARLMWTQFVNETRVRTFVAKNGGELLNFLKHLPVSHMDHSVSTTYSEDIESGYVEVSSDPNTKSICIVGSAEDV